MSLETHGQMRAQKQTPRTCLTGSQPSRGTTDLAGPLEQFEILEERIVQSHLQFLMSLEEAQTRYPLWLKKDHLGEGSCSDSFGFQASMFPGEKQERAWAAWTPSTLGTVSEPESPHIWLQLALVCFKFCTQTTTLAVNSGMAQAFLVHARVGGESASHLV